MPSITVAVSTFRENRFDWVMQLLVALKTQTFKDFKVLLLVNSNKKYFKRLQTAVNDSKEFSFEIKVVFNPEERGIAHDRNIALKNATTPYIAFTDDDATPCGDWLKIVYETFKTGKDVGAVTGPVIALWSPDVKDIESWFPKELYWLVGCSNSEFSCVREVRNGFASNLAFDRDVVVKCGGFNEAFGYKPKYRMVGEEPELCLRLKQQEKSTLWHPQLIVFHRVTHHRLKFANILVRSYIEGRTKAHLKKLLGNSGTEVEAQQMLSVIKGFLLSNSFRSKAYLVTTTTAVAAGYFITTLNISINRASKFKIQTQISK